MKTIIVVAFTLFARAVSAEIIDEKRLAQALTTLPGVKHNPDQLIVNAIEAAGPDLDPFVLLAQQYIESRFDPTATSRLIDGARQTGSWSSRRAPRGWTGNLYCGIAQSRASTWVACLALRDAKVAMAAQARELRTWLRRTRGDLPRALAAYGCGNVALRTGRCNGYPRRVLARAKQLRRVVAPLS